MSGDRDVHVVPLGDLVPHEVDEECPCGPEVRLVPGKAGDSWLVVHHSLDGREALEVE